MTSNDSRGHAVFEDTAYGLRAGIIVLRTYWMKHKLRSVSAILSRWAPSSDTIGSLPGAAPNSPAEYTRFVCKRVQCKPGETLEIFDEAGNIKNKVQLSHLVSAMAEYENYTGFYFTDMEFANAVNLV